MEEGINVLYVDDEPGLLEIARLFLEDAGNFRVSTSASAKDALQKSLIPSYDAIISDYQMPGMDGIAFLKEVRHQYGDIPFILFTGRGREEVVIEAINNGADFYLQKGGEPTAQFAELGHKIRQAVLRKRAEFSLVESEKRLSDIINFLPDATFAIDTSGRVIAWNHAIEEMTRVSAAEMLGKGDFEYAIPFYGTRRKILIDLIFEPDGVIARDYTHVSRKKDALNADTTLPHPLGKTVSLMGRASPLYNRLGEVVGAIESIRDITERRKSETELRAAYEQLAASEEDMRSQYRELALAHEKLWESRQQLSDIASTVPGVVYQFFVRPDGSREATYLSTRAPEVFCIHNDTDRVFERFTEHVDPRDREAFLRSIRESISSVSPWNFEGRFIRPDGKNIWFQGISLPVKKGSGLVFNGVLTDITARKMAEISLRENELRFQTIFEKTHEAFLIFSDGGFTDCNQAALDLFGYLLREEFTNLRPRDLSPEKQPDGRDSGQAEEEHVRTALERGSDQFIWTHTKKDGSTFIADILLSACELSGKRVLFCSIRDITERKTIENALHESEDRFRNIYCRSPIAIESYDRNGVLVDINPACCSLFGIPSAEAVKGFNLFSDPNVPPDQLVLLKSGATIHYESDFDFDLVKKMGLYPTTRTGRISLEVLVTPVRKSDGGSFGYLAQILDITGRKQAQEALREERERLQSIIKGTRVGTWEWNIRTGGLVVNGRWAEIVGYTLEELSPVSIRTWESLAHPDDLIQSGELLNRHFTGELPYYEFEARMRHKDGRWIWVLDRGQVILRSQDGRPLMMVGTHADITGRKLAEDALREANKKLNLLSGITRHDINNQLLVARGFMRALHQKIPDPACEKYFIRTEEAWGRISRMIQFTKHYEQIGMSAPVWQDCRILADTAVKDISPGNVVVINDLPAGTEVFADPLIVRVFYNLVDNAIRYGEKITQIHFFLQESAGCCRIICEDDGVGVPVEEKEQIFDHGFGKNTGMGLWLAREILSITNITITETGIPGEKARFEINVPQGAYRNAGEKE